MAIKSSSLWRNLTPHSQHAKSFWRIHARGKPLDAKEGPFRIIALGDKRAARWIRQVTVLRIVLVK